MASSQHPGRVFGPALAKPYGMLQPSQLAHSGAGAVVSGEVAQPGVGAVIAGNKRSEIQSRHRPERQPASSLQSARSQARRLSRLLRNHWKPITPFNAMATNSKSTRMDEQEARRANCDWKAAAPVRAPHNLEQVALIVNLPMTAGTISPCGSVVLPSTTTISLRTEISIAAPSVRLRTSGQGI